MTLFYQPSVREGECFLDPEESKHCARVLRRKVGELIDVTDGRGHFFQGRLTSTHSARCEFEVTREASEAARNFRIHIALSPTKSPERVAWFVEKAVEIGIDEISFLACRHTKRTGIKMPRLEKIAVSAMKQSLRATLPKINDIVSFADFVETQALGQRFVALIDPKHPQHLIKKAPRNESYCILIGPEGDFSMEEISMATRQRFEPVSLGSHRLRTESAALVAIHTLILVNL